MMWLGSIIPTHAQSNPPLTQISGNLLNDQNKPLDYASVSLLYAKDSSIVKGALSNDAGIYAFDKVKPGKYLIKTTNIGYDKAFSQPFQVYAGTAQITIPAIKMTRNSHNLQTVNIVASKPLIERQADRTVINVANSILAAGNSGFDILEKAPGVSIDKDDNISLKGKQGVTVMINDKQTYLSAAQLAALLRSTDGTTIQSIEIITNPSAKYDASGNSGIINIKLKKNNQSGTNGSVTLGVAAGKYFRDNGTFSLNHKEGKLNMFGTYSRSDNKRFQDIRINRIIKDKAGNTTLFNQETQIPYQNHNNSYRAGADYDISSKNTLGFVVSGYSNSQKDNTNDHTVIGSAPNVIDSSLRTKSTDQQTYNDFAVNLNDRIKIDTAGQELSIDLDYSRFRNNANAVYNNLFFLADGSEQHPPQVLTNQSPSVINIRTAKADYVKPLGKTLKLEAGAKYSDVKTDNNLQAQILNNGSFINDTSRTNHFIYDEKVAAGYLNLNKQLSKTTVQIGLRTEYTRSNGNLLGSTPVNRHYLDFFPSAFINQTINDKNEIGLSYSRRIDRPGYNDLNPFIYYLDPYTFQQGNSFLNPQYTNNFEANYTYNKKINVSAGYSHTTDAITEIVLTQGNKSFDTQRNLQSKTYYNVTVYSPYTITKWWSGNVNFTGFYQRFKADTIAGTDLNNGKAAFQVKTTQTLTFGKFKGEVMGTYNSALVYGIFSIKPNYGVDAGISRSFANKKANLKLAVSDIFNTRKTTSSSQLLNNNFVFMAKSDTRVERLTFTYNFGNNKIKANKHQSGADDETDRVKNNN